MGSYDINNIEDASALEIALSEAEVLFDTNKHISKPILAALKAT
jgi:hypothetical protein